jgi:hypothetical protein
MEEIGLSENQIGGLAVLESFRVVPGEHTIVELCVAGAVGDVNMIRSRILIDRHVLREIETPAVDEVVIAYIGHGLTQQRRRGVARRQKRRGVFEHSIVSQVRGKHVARRVDRDAARIAQAGGWGIKAEIAREVVLSNNRISCRVDTRSRGRFELKHAAVVEIRNI